MWGRAQARPLFARRILGSMTMVNLMLALPRTVARIAGSFFLGETIYPWPRDKY